MNKVRIESTEMNTLAFKSFVLISICGKPISLRNHCEITLPTNTAPSLHTVQSHWCFKQASRKWCSYPAAIAGYLTCFSLCTHLLHDRAVFGAWCRRSPTSAVHTCCSFLANSIPWLTNPASPSYSGSQDTLGTFATRPRVSGGHCRYHAPLTSSSRAGRFSRVRGWFSGLRWLACCLRPRTSNWNLAFLRVHVALTLTVMTLNFYF